MTVVKIDHLWRYFHLTFTQWFLTKYQKISDLDPPYTRPKTSVRTAQRLIAQGMGMKPSTMFGSSELRKQEEARKVRIQSRQNMRDDAWGSD